MYSKDQIFRNIRKIVASDILAQESGYQWELVRQLYNGMGYPDKASINRFDMEKKAATGRIDVYDKIAKVIWEMKRSSLDILNTKGVHNKGHEAINPTEQATNYMKSVQSEVAITTNGHQFYMWNAKGDCVSSLDMDSSQVTPTNVMTFFSKAFRGSHFDVFLAEMHQGMETLLDETIDKDQRKTSAAYWSNLSKSIDLFKSSPWYTARRKEMELAILHDSVDELWAVWKRVTTIKVLDPAVGGCALLVASHVSLCELERDIEDMLKVRGEVTNPCVNVRPENFYGIEKYDVQYEEALRIARQAMKKFDDFGGIEKPAHPYNIKHADALEISWREFIGDGECIIFANPPFTAGKHLSPEQKTQLHKFGLKDNLDAAFMVKAAQEHLYGIWIVNSSIAVTQDNVLNKVCHTVPGQVHTDIISNGSKSERWMFTSSGSGGCIGQVYSKVQLTDWANIVGSRLYFKCDAPNCVEAISYSGKSHIVSPDEAVHVTRKMYMVPSRVSVNTNLKSIESGWVCGTYLFDNMSEWTRKAFRLYLLWALGVEASVQGSGSYISVHPNRNVSINTFPLFQGDDLTHYDTMTDEEIFQELLAKYNALISK